MHNDNNSTTCPLQFTGKTSEFFKIWIVNIALSIITLGIYSAWAKVRTRRYFYSNILLMNSPFDYLGDPLKILKGRLIAVTIVILYSIAPSVSPLLQAGMMLLFLPFVPFIIIKALSFNAYNTAYHNIRFNFSGRYLQALWIFIGMPFLVAITLGLAYPYFTRARKNFIVSNMAYGSCPFQLTATTGQFYKIYLQVTAIILTLAILAGGLAYSLIPNLNIHTFANEDIIIILFAIMPLYFLMLLIIFVYLYTAISNLVINHTQLAGHRFSSQLQFGKMLWLSFSNILAIICSFGLMTPWAMLRMLRYRIQSITLHVNGNPEDFIAAETQKLQAIGEEIGDIFDLDISL